MAHVATPGVRGVLLKSLVVFSLTYVVALLSLLTLVHVTGMRANSGAAIGALMAGSMMAGSKYARLTGMPPQGRDLWFLVLVSFVLTVLIPLLASVAVYIADGGKFSELGQLASELKTMVVPMGFMAVVALLVGAANIFVIWLGYGWLTRMTRKRRKP